MSDAPSSQWFAVPPRGEVPIAFFPVRIETRFGKASDGSSQLWVRVFPDDVHESLLHSRWIYTLGRMETFLHKFLGEPVVKASNN